jgi:hypothetical protein
MVEPVPKPNFSNNSSTLLSLNDRIREGTRRRISTAKEHEGTRRAQFRVFGLQLVPPSCALFAFVVKILRDAFSLIELLTVLLRFAHKLSIFQNPVSFKKCLRFQNLTFLNRLIGKQFSVHEE